MRTSALSKILVVPEPGRLRRWPSARRTSAPSGTAGTRSSTRSSTSRS
ncbi:MAG: hypothetical protein M0C28_39260 [Candidatus Moduliflexus flocculans]|nr:hypothetical protein [Candidatus Moduliflexus flocculans]